MLRKNTNDKDANDNDSVIDNNKIIIMVKERINIVVKERI